MKLLPLDELELVEVLEPVHVEVVDRQLRAGRTALEAVLATLTGGERDAD